MDRVVLYLFELAKLSNTENRRKGTVLHDSRALHLHKLKYGTLIQGVSYYEKWDQKIAYML